MYTTIKGRLKSREVWIVHAVGFLMVCLPLARSYAFDPVVVYKTNDLVITQVSENAFQHTSFKQTNDFGYVPCNGLIVIGNKEAVVFDTPTTNKTSTELIGWIEGKLGCRIKAVIPTHFHDDCLGGLKSFHEHGISSYANLKTIELARGFDFGVPQHGFRDSLSLTVGGQPVVARFFGEGHSRDNVVGYFPSEAVMFGGCLIRETGSSKGYLGDANVSEWSATVEKVRKAYPLVKLVIPGHGKPGDRSLLDYTINLYKNP